MRYRGHVENGVIHVDDPIALPEGASVRFEITSSSETAPNDAPGPSFAARFADVLGKAQSLPEDAAENHDHYLYGSPKK